MSAITTHVLDTARGCPASGIHVVLERMDRGAQWTAIGEGTTDAEGRLGTLLPAGASPTPGSYRLLFETAAYFQAQRVSTFYPHVLVTFTVGADPHYHVPLLVSPFGYSTYRGS